MTICLTIAHAITDLCLITTAASQLPASYQPVVGGGGVGGKYVSIFPSLVYCDTLMYTRRA